MVSPINPVFDNLKPSPTLYINEEVSRLWQAGKTVYHLGFGESRFPVHPKLQQALAEQVHQKSYLAAQGLASLREQIASFYNRHLDLDTKSKNIVVGPGSKALIYAIQLVLDADLLLPTPSWVSYEPQAEILNKKVSYIPATLESGYELTLDALDKVVKTVNNPNKLLILNSPNNPTGKTFSKAFLKSLADYCRENNILVLSDEIYFLVSYDDTPPTQSTSKHSSIAHYYPEGTLVLGGLSKHLSIGGWRVGTAILPDNKLGRRLVELLTVVASEIWSSVPAPIQYAVSVAYSNDVDIQHYIQTCTRLHSIRTRYLHQKLTQLNITCTEPLGAFYLVANFDHWKAKLSKKSVYNSQELAKYLLNTYQIATLPGSAFGIPKSELSLRLATSYLDLEKDEDAEKLLNNFNKLENTDDAVPNNLISEQIMSKDNHPKMHAAIAAFERFIRELDD
jgi:aspartate/methionine/tyrosine aminotransferase